MQIRWNLRDWLRKERDQTRPTQISRIIYKRTGYKLSVQAVAELLNSEPKMLRLETLQAICSSFHCRVSDFLEVVPGPSSPVTREAEFDSVDISGVTTGIPSQRTGETSLSVGIPNWANFYPDARSFSSQQTTTK